MKRLHISRRVVPAAVMLCVFALAGCGGLEWPPWSSSGPRPAPHSHPQRSQAPRSQPAAPPPARSSVAPATAPQTLAPRAVPAPSQGEVTVAAGDTVYGLARRHDVSVRALIDANDLSPPYLLVPGQRITLPRTASHIVGTDETLYSISRRYGIDVYQLARANRIGRPYRIYPGQRLVLPGGADVAAAVAARENPSPSESPVETAPLRPPPNATASLPRPGVVRPAPPSPPPPRRRRSSSGFSWPVNGKVISSFGSKGNGLHNDGINIAAPRGTAVRATASGIVAYAGNELRGFGNLLLIKHPGGWVTAYAHNDDLLVKRGDRVQKGQIIARVGSTGNVGKPQLHFELRRGNKAVDPTGHLHPA